MKPLLVGFFHYILGKPYMSANEYDYNFDFDLFLDHYHGLDLDLLENGLL